MMKRNVLPLFLCAVLILFSLPVYADETTENTADISQKDKSLDYSIFAEYTACVESFIAGSSENEYFKPFYDYEILSINLLYSFENSDVLQGLIYDVKSVDGHRAHYIVDYERCTIAAAAAYASPFTKFLLSNTAPVKLFFSPIYYLAAVNDTKSDTVRIIDCITGEDVTDKIVDDIPISEIRIETKQIPDVVMSEKQIAKRTARDNLTNSVYSAERSYPNYLVISGVPAHIQTTACPCIPNSILNVVGYWALNGYPMLLTSISDARTDIVYARECKTDCVNLNIHILPIKIICIF